MFIHTFNVCECVDKNVCASVRSRRAQSNGGELLFSFTTFTVAVAVRSRAISGSFQISTVALERYFVRRGCRSKPSTV